VKRNLISAVIGAAWFLFFGCDGLSDFSTKPGQCYEGDIIDAEFVRNGSFEAGVRLSLVLDVDALADAEKEGARLTTDDGLFVNAPVRQMESVSLDSLSLLSFPSGRVRNYLAYAPDREGEMANVVISLMENGDVEVRVFRPAQDPDESLFGVFRASRKKGCQAGTVDE
jgi:hypothetical protein